MSLRCSRRLAIAVVGSSVFNGLLIIAAFLNDRPVGEDSVFWERLRLWFAPGAFVAEPFARKGRVTAAYVVVMVLGQLVFYAVIAWLLMGIGAWLLTKVGTNFRDPKMTSRWIGIRWGAALMAVSAGWLIGIAVYAIDLAGFSAALTSTAIFALAHSGHGLVSGLFCFAAWVVVGLPLALWNPEFSSPARIVTATWLCSVIGVLMLCLVFRSLGPIFSIFGLMAFITAAASMLIYIALLRFLNARFA